MQQLALDTEDEAPTQVGRGEAHAAVVFALQSPDLSDPPALHAPDVGLQLAAIIASAHACARWLAATPPNVERARAAAERIIRDAHAAAEIAARLQRGPRAHPAPVAERET